MLSHTLDHLNNGLTIIRVPMPAFESVTVLVLANTGSRYETPHQQGIAHFLEHMVFKGTALYPTAQDLAKAMDAIGADFNAYTSKEYTGYYVRAAARHLDLAITTVSDMLLTPHLRQEDIDREKGVIIEEINMYADTPARHIGDLFDRMAYKGTGLDHDVIGTKETVSALTTADFRQFLDQWYGPGNLVVVVAGSAEVVNDPSLLAKIEQAWGKSPVDRRPNKQDIKPFLAANPLSAVRLLLEHKKTEQAHFIMGFPGIKRSDKHRPILTMLSTVLGGNTSSRLFTEVREKRGLCYYVSTDTDILHDGGIFGASAGVDPNRIDEAIQVTYQEFLDIANGSRPVTAEELDRAKEYMAGKIALSLEDSESVAQFLGMKQLLLGKVETPMEVLKQIRAVTLEQVNSMAKELVQADQVKFALIGPFDQPDRFKKLLTIT